LKTPNGLTEDEALILLKEFGPNEIHTVKKSSWISRFSDFFSDPMALMLLGLALVYYLLGQHSDAYVMIVAVIPVLATDVFLEWRAQNALSLMKKNLPTSCKVIRNKVIKSIATRNLVPNDLLLFEEGSTLSADGLIEDCEGLSIDESHLTGESIPVEKKIGEFFYSGTTVIHGRGIGKIQKTALNTRYGQISALLENADSSKSPLRETIEKLVKDLLKVALGFMALLFILEYFRTQSISNSFIAALTLGMAAMPEEFPIVFTLYLSLGAWRLAKKGVIVRSLPSVEALGRIDVLCTDKTGTLTQGLFQLEKIIPIDGDQELNLSVELLLACELHPVDSLEKSIFDYISKKFGSNFITQVHNEWKLTWDYPFENHGKHMSHVWRKLESNEEILVMKGAIEGILEHTLIKDFQKEKAENLIEKYALSGKRVLALASKKSKFEGHRISDEKDVSLKALLIFNDPIRMEVKKAIDNCQKNHIEIKMLTGDHIHTAHAVAEAVGIQHDDEHIFSGEELFKMSMHERRLAYLRGDIFARVLPEQKYELIKTLKEDGKKVAMTGDGVNDAPAIKLADIGISMGSQATDLTRSQAEIILQKDDFRGIVFALFEGRQIFINLKKSFSYLISFHVPILLLSLIPSLLGWPLLLMPIHIVTLELIVHPISALVFENMPASSFELARKPSTHLLTRKDFLINFLSGLSVSLVSLFLFQQEKNNSLELARSLAFLTFLIGNIYFVFLESLNKRELFNLKVFLQKRLLICALFSIVFTFMIHTWPGSQAFFHFEVLHVAQFLRVFSLVSLSLSWRVIWNFFQK
jgi:Ca2+-transporting ATPase